MTMSKEFTVRDSPTSVGIPDPQGVVDVAANAAKVLSKVLEQKPKPVIINGEKYLEFEDWETLGQFYGVTVITGEALPVEIGGVKGAKAIAKLVDFHNGEIVGGAEAYCMRDEEKWGTRPKLSGRGKGRTQRKSKSGTNLCPGINWPQWHKPGPELRLSATALLG